MYMVHVKKLVNKYSLINQFFRFSQIDKRLCSFIEHLKNKPFLSLSYYVT